MTNSGADGGATASSSEVSTPVSVSWATFLGVTAVTVFSLSWLVALSFDLRQVIRALGSTYFLIGPGLLLIALGSLIALVLVLRASRRVPRPLPIALGVCAGMGVWIAWLGYWSGSIRYRGGSAPGFVGDILEAVLLSLACVGFYVVVAIMLSSRRAEAIFRRLRRFAYQSAAGDNAPAPVNGANAAVRGAAMSRQRSEPAQKGVAVGLISAVGALVCTLTAYPTVQSDAGQALVVAFVCLLSLVAGFQAVDWHGGHAWVGSSWIGVSFVTFLTGTYPTAWMAYLAALTIIVILLSSAFFGLLVRPYIVFFRILMVWTCLALLIELRRFDTLEIARIISKTPWMTAMAEWRWTIGGLIVATALAVAILRAGRGALWPPSIFERVWRRHTAGSPEHLESVIASLGQSSNLRDALQAARSIIRSVWLTLSQISQVVGKFALHLAKRLRRELMLLTTSIRRDGRFIVSLFLGTLWLGLVIIAGALTTYFYFDIRAYFLSPNWFWQVTGAYSIQAVKLIFICLILPATVAVALASTSWKKHNLGATIVRTALYSVVGGGGGYFIGWALLAATRSLNIGVVGFLFLLLIVAVMVSQLFYRPDRKLDASAE